MSDVMQGIHEDVRFDHAAADALATGCRNAASAIEGQAPSRAAWVNHGLVDFAGYYSELFSQNGTTQAGDATRLVAALRDVATKVDHLAACARTEQARRQTARAWKQRQDDRGLWDHVSDWFTGGEAPPVGAPDPVAPQVVPIPSPPQRQALAGSGATGTSSARPANLRSFATNSAAANDELAWRPGSLTTAYDTFVAGCGWGTLDAAGVFTAFGQYLTANGQDAQWANTVAAAFEAAGGDGAITVSNAAITASLQAGGVTSTRADLAIDPAQALGAPPTTGYANDPVNTATGNFLEPETDLAFTGGASGLRFTRVYNSLNPAVGAFGPGWSSWTESGLVFSDAEARWVLDDGRHLVFPRLGDGWERATSEAYWLTREGDGHAISDSAGGRWAFDAAGRLTATEAGPGTRITLTWDGTRLAGLTHERGRWVELSWRDDRVAAAVASDGRRVGYAYDEAGRLVSATSTRGTRRYDWNSAGLVFRVTDADGVVECENAYDDHGRVTQQRSAHGRVTRFSYLPGHVTAVFDPDGSRSNTWIHDARGRLVGIVDAHDQRQSLARDRYGNVVMATARDGSLTLSEYDARSRPTVEVTPSGARVDTEWDDLDRVTAVTVDDGAGRPTVVRYTYTADARTPDALVDGEGGTTRLEWLDGQLSATTDPTGVRVELSYDAHGDLVALTNAAGDAARIERDAVGRVVAALTPLGHRTEYAWEGETLASRTDPDGATWRFEHTAAGRLAAVVDPYGARTEVARDASGDGTTTTDPLGRRTVQSVDELGNLAFVELPDGSRWQFVHDALSRLVAVTDPEGATWQWEHDVLGRPVEVVDPTGRGRRITRGEGGTSIRTTNLAGGSPAEIRTDRLGRIVSSSWVGTGSQLTRYDQCGRPVEFVDADGNVTSLERDAAGRPVALRRADGSVTRYAYDLVGRLVSTTVSTGATYRFAYDADGRLTEEVDPAGATARYAYDANGRLTESVRPGQGRETWSYDLAGRVVATRNRLWGLRRFAYDDSGQLVGATDARGGVTRFTLDALGRAVATTDPLGNTVRRSYDGRDRILTQADPLGRATSADYDGAGRVVHKSTPTGERYSVEHDADGALSRLAVGGRTVAEYRRDPVVRILVVKDHTDPDRPVEHRLAWDARGHLVERARDGQAVRWAWNAVGLCEAVTAPDGVRTRYHHDAAGHLIGVDAGPLGTAELAHDGAGRLVRATAGGVTQTWAHHAGDVVEHTLRAPGAEVDTRIERDAEGRITAAVRDGVRTTYTHDEAGRLTAAETGGALRTWAYDAGGRLVGETDGDLATTYSYDAAGQLLASERATGTTTYTHDAAGRRTGEDGPAGTVAFTWGALGWLTGITGPSGHTSVHVDALGELARVDDADLFWDTARPGFAPVQAGRDAIVAVPGLVGGPDGWHAAGWRPQRGEGEPNGEPLDARDPWAPGAGVPGVGVGAVQLGAAGQVLLGGLEWLGQRVHDPATRGFLSPDPLEAILGTAWAGNPYSYAGNDPLHALDPTGLRPVTDAELAAYTHQHHTGSFWDRNGTAITGALIAGAGVALMFAPFPGAQIVGGMVMSAGFDVLQQGIANPGQFPDMRSVALSAAAGAIPGGGSTLVRAVATGAATGAATNAASTGILGLMDGHSLAQVLPAMGESAIWGGVTGGVGGGIDFAASPRPTVGSPVTPTPTPSPATDLVPVTPPVGTTPSPLVVPDSMPSPLVVPAPPAGTVQTPGGLYVPDVPAGMSQSPGGLLVPDPPAGMSQTPSGLYVPTGSIP